MPTYLQPAETDKLPLPSDPEYYVVMKRRAAYGDQLAAQTAMIRVDQSPVPSTNGAPATPQAKMDWGAYTRELTVRLITQWNLSDEGGHPLPITAANIDRLTQEDGEFLAGEARKRLGTRAPDKERDFAQPSSGSSAITK